MSNELVIPASERMSFGMAFDYILEEWSSVCLRKWIKYNAVGFMLDYYKHKSCLVIKLRKCFKYHDFYIVTE